MTGRVGGILTPHGAGDRFACPDHASTPARLPASIGRRTVNVVPLPMTLSKVRLPHGDARRPGRARVPGPGRPLPTSLVVKNGSKMRARSAAGMPPPVSLDRSTTASPSSLVSQPRFAGRRCRFASSIACEELMTILKIIWLISPTGRHRGSHEVDLDFCDVLVLATRDLHGAANRPVQVDWLHLPRSGWAKSFIDRTIADAVEPFE